MINSHRRHRRHRRHHRAHRAAFVFGAAVLLATSAAWATPEDSARAVKLYDEALVDFDKGEWAAACPKLEESQRLDPAVGTQFNIADCWEHIGRIGPAYRLFLSVTKVAHAAGRDKLEAKAQLRVDALSKRVGVVRMIFTETIRAVVVQVDDVEISADEWRAGYAVEPGEHTVSITAPDKQPWSRRIRVEPAQKADVAVALTSSSAPRPVETQRDPLFRIGGVTLAAVGVVGLGVGAVFGLNTLSKRNDARELCENPSPCTDRKGADLWNDAKSSGDVSTIAFVAGGVLVAAGAVLWFVAPSRPVSVSASIDPRGGAIVGGAF